MKTRTKRGDINVSFIFLHFCIRFLIDKFRQKTSERRRANDIMSYRYRRAVVNQLDDMLAKYPPYSNICKRSTSLRDVNAIIVRASHRQAKKNHRTFTFCLLSVLVSDFLNRIYLYTKFMTTKISMMTIISSNIFNKIVINKNLSKY